MDVILMSWSWILVAMAGAMGAVLILARARQRAEAVAKRASIRNPRAAYLLSAPKPVKQRSSVNPLKRMSTSDVRDRH